MAGEDALFQRFGREFRRGDVLFREGEPGKEMYVIQAGKVNITKTVRETEKILATLGAGEFFGEMSILNNKPRSAGAVVAEDANLLLRDPNSRVVHYLWQAALKRGKDTPQGKLVAVNLNELHVRMGVSAQEVQEAVNKTAKARIISLVPEGVLVPDTGKMKKYLEFLEMKERFGD